MLSRLTLVSPRSQRLTKVRSTPALLASSSCDHFLSVRSCRNLRPNRRFGAGVMIRVMVTVSATDVYKSTAFESTDVRSTPAIVASHAQWLTTSRIGSIQAEYTRKGSILVAS